MIVRRYYGETVDEAMEAAKRDLGAHVVVLLTKRLSPDPSDERVELVVAVDAQNANLRDDTELIPRRDVRERRDVSHPLRGYATRHTTASAIREEPPPPARQQQQPQAQVDAREGSSVERLRTERARNAYGGPPQRPQYRTPMTQLLRERLQEQEVDEEVIRLFVEELGGAEPDSDDDVSAAREVLRRGLAKSLPIAGEMRKKKGTSVVAFVGPTGVGKTTTIAKLAARAHLTDKRPVRLVTVDTYRIAGAEQLRTYARILGVPCDVVMTPAALSDAVDGAEPGELVFVDTPGRSPANRQQLVELRNVLDAVERDETYLLVSGTTRSVDLWEVARGFHALEPNRLIFTKLDEAANFGNIVNFSYRQRLPLSYFTTGQTVPDDIESVSPDRLASLLLRTRRLVYC